MSALARSTDPLTSHIAAARAEKFSGSHIERIKFALAVLGDATAKELSHETGLSIVQIDRRLPEMAEAKTAHVKCVSGQPLTRGGYRVWELLKGQSLNGEAND